MARAAHRFASSRCHIITCYPSLIYLRAVYVPAASLHRIPYYAFLRTHSSLFNEIYSEALLDFFFLMGDVALLVVCYPRGVYARHYYHRAYRVAELFHYLRPPYYLRVGVQPFCHSFDYLLALAYRYVVATSDVYQCSPRAVYTDIQQGIGLRPFHSFGSPRFRVWIAHSYHSQPAARHHCSYVGEIQIYESRHRDKFCDSFHSVYEYLIRDLERRRKRNVRHYFQQLVIRYYNKSVHHLLQVFQPVLRVLHPRPSFHSERNRDYAYCKGACLFSYFCDNRQRTGSCSASHSARQKDHVRLFQRVLQIILVFLGSFLADFRVCARAQPACKLFSDKYLDVRIRVKKILRIRVYRDGLRPDNAYLTEA